MRRLILFALALSLQAESPDLKRNQKVQKLASEVLRAQSAYDAEMKAWIAECGNKGLDLRPVAGNLMDCIAKPQAAQQQRPSVQQQSSGANSPNIHNVQGDVNIPPRPAPAKPEAPK